MIRNLAHWTAMLGMAAALYACGGDDGGGGECKPGGAGCACLEDNKCNDGLSCVESKCSGTFDVGLTVSNKAARACDVLLTEKSSHVESVGFDEAAVKGTFVRQAPKVAVSFASAKDAPISGISLKLVGAGNDGVEVASAKCADAQGKSIENVSVALKN